MSDRPLCPKCGLVLVVVASKPAEDRRLQYLGCVTCGVYGGAPKQVIALSDRRTRIVRK